MRAVLVVPDGARLAGLNQLLAQGVLTVTVADNFPLERAAAGLTQAALAEKARLSLRTVQAWEQGARSPVSPDFFALVRALGVPAEAFAAIEANGRRRATGRTKKGRGKGK